MYQIEMNPLHHAYFLTDKFLVVFTIPRKKEKEFIIKAKQTSSHVPHCQGNLGFGGVEYT